MTSEQPYLDEHHHAGDEDERHVEGQELEQSERQAALLSAPVHGCTFTLRHNNQEVLTGLTSIVWISEGCQGYNLPPQRT